jgi:hypothetical protein
MAEHSEIGAEAEAAIERLRTLPTVRSFDRSRAETALAQHLSALGLEPRPVRWIESASDDHLAAVRDGFISAWAALGRDKRGRPDVGLTATASFAALHGTGLRRRGLVGAAWKEEKNAGRGIRRAAEKAAETARHRVQEPARRVARRVELGRAVEDALAEKGIHRRTTMAQAVTISPEGQHDRQDAELDREISKGDAASAATEAAAWLARAHTLRVAEQPADAVERVAQVYLPLVDAVEAGLWLFWVTEDDVIAVPVPAT